MYARCSYCQARRTLTRRPDEYIRLPRCPSNTCNNRSKRMGRPTRYYVDHYRLKHERGQSAPKPCNPGRGGCDGYPFPHRRGSLHCMHNPNRPADTEFGWP